MAVAQAEYSEELLEENEDKKEITEEAKEKALSLKEAAIINTKKYLEIDPEAEDKDTIEQLLEDLNKEKTEEQPILLKG